MIPHYMTGEGGGAAWGKSWSCLIPSRRAGALGSAVGQSKNDHAGASYALLDPLHVRNRRGAGVHPASFLFAGPLLSAAGRVTVCDDSFDAIGTSGWWSTLLGVGNKL